jgi:hypothetical protein
MLEEKLHCQGYNWDASTLLLLSIIYYLSTGKDRILFVFLISRTFFAHCKCPEIKESLQIYITPHIIEQQHEMGLFISYRMSQLSLP